MAVFRRIWRFAGLVAMLALLGLAIYLRLAYIAGRL